MPAVAVCRCGGQNEMLRIVPYTKPNAGEGEVRLRFERHVRGELQVLVGILERQLQALSERWWPAPVPGTAWQRTAWQRTAWQRTAFRSATGTVATVTAATLRQPSR